MVCGKELIIYVNFLINFHVMTQLPSKFTWTSVSSSSLKKINTIFLNIRIPTQYLEKIFYKSLKNLIARLVSFELSSHRMSMPDKHLISTEMLSENKYEIFVQTPICMGCCRSANFLVLRLTNLSVINNSMTWGKSSRDSGYQVFYSLNGNNTFHLTLQRCCKNQLREVKILGARVAQ